MPHADTVVLLHGIIKTERSMEPMADMLARHDYDVLNIGYPSTEHSIDALVEMLHRQYLTPVFWQQVRRVHFVVHSMGGLITRRYLNRYRNQIPAEKIGRVVMLGTPNEGSQLADLLRALPPYKKVFGPAGQEFTSKARRQADEPLFFETGIIAGSKSWPHYLGRIFLPGQNDGRVAVERTKTAGMTDHTVIHVSHNRLMEHPDVQMQTLAFLQTGKFV